MAGCTSAELKRRLLSASSRSANFSKTLSTMMRDSGSSRSLSLSDVMVDHLDDTQNMLEGLRSDRNQYRKTLLEQKNDMKVAGLPPIVCF